MPLDVVYIDDEPGLCQAFVDNFGGPGINVTTFTDPQAGVAAVRGKGADIVFLDFRLPNTSGDEVAAKMPAHVPIVLVSGDLSLSVGHRFLKLFGKPFDFDEIEVFLAEMVAKKSAA